MGRASTSAVVVAASPLPTSACPAGCAGSASMMLVMTTSSSDSPHARPPLPVRCLLFVPVVAAKTAVQRVAALSADDGEVDLLVDRTLRQEQLYMVADLAVQPLRDAVGIGEVVCSRKRATGLDGR